MYGSNEYGSVPYGSDRGSYVVNTSSLNETATLTEIKSKSSTRILSEISTVSEIFSKSVSRIKTDIITTTDILARAVSRFIQDLFSGLVDIDIDTQKSRGLEKIDGITLSESIKKDSTRNLVDTSTLTDVMSRIQHLSKSLVDSFSGLVDSILFGQQRNKEISDTLNISDNINRSVAHFLYDIGHLSEVFSRSRGQLKSLTDTTTLTDNFRRAITKVLTESLSLLDRIKKYLNGNYIVQYLYQTKNTVFSNKYSAKNTTFTNKYSSKPTVYSNKYNDKETNY